MKDTEKARESRLRRRLAHVGVHGTRMHKSRRQLSGDNFGKYQLVDNHQNIVIAGSDYDWSLDDIEEWLNDREAKA